MNDKSLSVDFESETPKQKHERTLRWRALLRQALLNDLPYQHKTCWARIAAEIRQRIRTASDEETKARAEQELQEHYKDHLNPESSREALLAEIDTREFLRPVCSDLKFRVANDSMKLSTPAQI